MDWLEPLVIAFLGGVVTSASPCSLAAVPVAIGYVGGNGTSFRRSLLLSVAVVSGMVVTLMLLGVFAARAGVLLAFLPGTWTIAVGVFLVALGAGIAVGVFDPSATIPKALGARLAGSGIPGATVVGALLGTVMSPCATPALAVALALAGAGAWLDGSVWTGIVLLAAYGLGRGVVVLAAGSLPAFAQSLALRTATWARWIPGKRAFGSLLALAGLWWMGQGLAT